MPKEYITDPKRQSISNPRQDSGLDIQLISLVEAAKLAGFNARELTFDGKDGGYSNQEDGYYDTRPVVDDLKSLIQILVQEAKQEAINQYKYELLAQLKHPEEDYVRTRMAMLDGENTNQLKDSSKKE